MAVKSDKVAERKAKGGRSRFPSKVVADPHEEQCRICKSKKRTDLEVDFILGASIGTLSVTYKFSMAAIERHVIHFNLREKRDNSLLAYAQRILLRRDETGYSSDALSSRAMEVVGRITGEFEQKPQKHEIDINLRIQEGVDRVLNNYANRVGGMVMEDDPRLTVTCPDCGRHVFHKPMSIGKTNGSERIATLVQGFMCIKCQRFTPKAEFLERYKVVDNAKLERACEPQIPGISGEDERA